MPYIPKSRIQPNLYTAGKDYVIQSTLKPYVGYFYRTYTGEVFTGKNPDDKPNFPLIPALNPISSETPSSICSIAYILNL